MQILKTKINAVKTVLAEYSLNDPRLFGLLLLAAIGLSVLWSGVGVVEKNYELQQKVAILEEENRILELENGNKSIQNEYFKTPEFAELKARRVNGKALPGETVYTIDDEVALKALKAEDQVPAESPDDIVDTPKYQQNFEAWMQFFFGS